MQPRWSLRWKFCFVQALTLVRVPLIFLFLAVSVFFGHPLPEFWFVVAFAAMILSAVTDLFDGYFARKFQVTSRLGSYADPMTDKVFYLTCSLHGPLLAGPARRTASAGRGRSQGELSSAASSHRR
jgi:phosphatidylglycerophosphate synthase